MKLFDSFLVSILKFQSPFCFGLSWRKSEHTLKTFSLTFNVPLQVHLCKGISFYSTHRKFQIILQADPYFWIQIVWVFFQFLRILFLRKPCCHGYSSLSFPIRSLEATWWWFAQHCWSTPLPYHCSWVFCHKFPETLWQAFPVPWAIPSYSWAFCPSFA